MARLYRYVVRYDGGSAPNPFGGMCTLAVCKPAIRRTAKVGDWIIGLRGGDTERVTYVMKVSEVLPLERYWDDRRFGLKKPGASSVPDNFHRSNERGELEQVPNVVHEPGDLIRDSSGRNVLIANDFWYFGNECPRLPDELHHLKHNTQGHSVNIRRRVDDFVKLEDWLARWEPGLHGVPADAKPGFMAPNAVPERAKRGCKR